MDSPHFELPVTLSTASSGENVGQFGFKTPERLSASLPRDDVIEKVRRAIEVDELPIVISDWNLEDIWENKAEDLFSMNGISKHFNRFTHNENRTIIVRDQITMEDRTIKLKELLRSLGQEDCPYYWKDEDQIPKTWDNFLKDLLPEELTFCGPFDLNKRPKENPKVSSSNLMSYIGGHGSWTPCHFDHCGSIGHNIMTWADLDSSSVWYIASPRDYDKVKRAWESWGKFFEQEKYPATMDQMLESGIDFYRVDQRPGDLVILPPMAPYQVYNKGKATVKIAWNRITPKTALNAIENVLPRYREIARPEAYKVKAAVYAAVLEGCPRLTPQRSDSFLKSFVVCLEALGRILYDDWIEMKHIEGRRQLSFPDDHIFQEPVTVEGGETLTLVCSFCQADIWNRHLICGNKHHPKTKSYLLCMECFGRGRGCPHRDTSELVIRQCFRMDFPISLFAMSVKRVTELQKTLRWFKNFIVKPWNVQCQSSIDTVLSSATVAYARYHLFREREKGGSKKKIMCSECETTRTNLMTLYCLDPRRPRHKTTKKSSINKYDYQKRPCQLKWCENCILKHGDTTWFRAIKWGEIFRCKSCKGCSEDEEKQGSETVLKFEWYAKPTLFCNMNRGAVDDPDFLGHRESSFTRRFQKRSRDLDVDQRRINDSKGKEDDINEAMRKKR